MKIVVIKYVTYTVDKNDRSTLTRERKKENAVLFFWNQTIEQGKDAGATFILIIPLFLSCMILLHYFAL